MYDHNPFGEENEPANATLDCDFPDYLGERRDGDAFSGEVHFTPPEKWEVVYKTAGTERTTFTLERQEPYPDPSDDSTVHAFTHREWCYE